MRRAVCSALVVAAIAASSSASGDAGTCEPGTVRPCTGHYPAGVVGDADSFAGEQRCVARDRGRGTFAACEAIACAGKVTLSCATTKNEAGIAQCQERFTTADDPRSLGFAFGGCGAPRECRPEETKNCPGNPSISASGAILQMRCVLDKAEWKFSTGPCMTPLVLAFDEGPVTFTDAPGSFAIGAAERTEWVDAATPWLAIDLDGDGVVDDQSELLGSATAGSAHENGFTALAAFDDDRDGRITPRDAVWSKLRVWRDTNQDRRSTPDEMTTLDAEHVTSIGLAFVSLPTRTTSYEGETATFTFGEGRTGRVVDVHLAPE